MDPTSNLATGGGQVASANSMGPQFYGDSPLSDWTAGSVPGLPGVYLGRNLVIGNLDVPVVYLLLGLAAIAFLSVPVARS